MIPSDKKYILPLLLSGFLALGLWIGHVMTPQMSNAIGSQGQEKYQKLQDIIEILDKKYVDTVNGEALFERTISDMLHELDPHSNYIAAKDLQAMNESIEGKFGGVGIRFMILRDTICVTNIISGSPSQRAGVRPGDKILQVDGKKVKGKTITNEKVMAMLKGTENTPVSVELLRGKKIVRKRIIRGVIPIESVVAAYMVNSTIGYIKVDEFSVTTPDEFRMAASWLQQKGMQKLILDLRNNGGGVLQSAIALADEFLPKGLAIVKTKGEHTGSYTYRSTSTGMLEKTQVAVLINSSSASASEIVAGALQDNDRGTIIGRRSFGKGLVQEDIRLRDGSDLRLTVSRYYTPTGRCIQKPYKDGYDKYMEDQIDRYDNGELYKPDSSVFVDSLKFRTPKGKIVYGGGGIMPDVFVPFDSSGSSLYFTELRYSQAFSGFAFDFVQNKRMQWKDPKVFTKTFTVEDKLVDRFVAFAEKEFKIKRNASELKHSRKLIAETLKSEIARQLWMEEGFYQVFNATDNEFEKAVQFLSK
jgi:carboxyl-terminal processing protease